jgi:hypothetical protein
MQFSYIIIMDCVVRQIPAITDALFLHEGSPKAALLITRVYERPYFAVEESTLLAASFVVGRRL